MSSPQTPNFIEPLLRILPKRSPDANALRTLACQYLYDKVGNQLETIADHLCRYDIGNTEQHQALVDEAQHQARELAATISTSEEEGYCCPVTVDQVSLREEIARQLAEMILTMVMTAHRDVVR